MDDTYRLKIKIGNFEFEAEGPPDAVREQFQSFKELVAMCPPAAEPKAQETPVDSSLPPLLPPAPTDMASIDSSLDKIMRLDNRIVSLTVRPTSPEEATLLLLYGQKVKRQNDSVTGYEILTGFETTGLGSPRVDRLMDKLSQDGDAIVIGERRAKRYRLTNAGLIKARQIAAKFIASVA